jgi:hypothetical protein
MLISQSKDAKHKAWHYRILSAIYDDPYLPSVLYFKGGTCAAMLGLLDRFSVDLDFDLTEKKSGLAGVRNSLKKIFSDLGLVIKDQSRQVPRYFLKYPGKNSERNTLKIDVTYPPVKANKYEARRFSEIDRIITCQTTETMFANKLVAFIDRYKKRQAIAGRDLYDIHYFFFSGLRYEGGVIKERTGQNLRDFFKGLAEFTEKKITDTIIAQDLNTLLPYEKFRVIRKTLKKETLIFLRDELKRLENEK